MNSKDKKIIIVLIRNTCQQLNKRKRYLINKHKNTDEVKKINIKLENLIRIQNDLKPDTSVE